jgi:hypoxanthine-guanine phosphoribosyltransferase
MTRREKSALRALEEERQQARELGRQINRKARRNPNSPYTGKVVGILRGKVVIVADTLNEVAKVLERLEPDAQRCYFIDASEDYNAQYTIWMQGACRE